MRNINFKIYVLYKPTYKASINAVGLAASNGYSWTRLKTNRIESYIKICNGFDRFVKYNKTRGISNG